ncbi:hypothetical protein [Streptosporangium canum]|uniref:hypothetical protein n=1 Tax=Streptosporangium canum TaxID=324952 RepID=UPI0034259629
MHSRPHLKGHESARSRGKATGGAAGTGPAMPSLAVHLRGQDLNLSEIAARLVVIKGKLVIIKGKKKGQHPSPATVLRMLREHDEADSTAPAATATATAS